MKNNISISWSPLLASLSALMILTPNISHATPIQVQLEGTVTYIDGDNTGVPDTRMSAVLGSSLQAGDSVSMFFEFDPARANEVSAFNDSKIYWDVIGDWGINFNNGALVIDHDPLVTTNTRNTTWLNTSGQSYFATWDYEFARTGTSGAIEGPQFAPTEDFITNWVPWQMVLFIDSPTTNDFVSPEPIFEHMRFDYVASRYNQNQQLQNWQSGISVRWDSSEFITASTVPVPATIWLFGSAVFGFARFNRFKKKTT